MLEFLTTTRRFNSLNKLKQASVAVYLSKYADGTGDNFKSGQLHQGRVFKWLKDLNPKVDKRGMPISGEFDGEDLLRAIFNQPSKIS